MARTVFVLQLRGPVLIGQVNELELDPKLLLPAVRVQVPPDAIHARLAIGGKDGSAPSLKLGGRAIETALHADRDLEPRGGANMDGMRGVNR